jgi:hypothetical protein
MFLPYPVVASIVEDRLRVAELERRARPARAQRPPRRASLRWGGPVRVGDRP